MLHRGQAAIQGISQEVAAITVFKKERLRVMKDHPYAWRIYSPLDLPQGLQRGIVFLGVDSSGAFDDDVHILPRLLRRRVRRRLRAAFAF